MAKFGTASAALTTALATVDARLQNIEINEQLELYLELINRRATIQQAIAASGGGGSITNYYLAQEQFTETQLTAPASTTSRSMAGYKSAFIQVVVASININVVLRIEGSNDGTNWINLNASDINTTITSNGAYAFQYQGCPQFIRTTFVSESGGTSATIDVITRLSA